AVDAFAALFADLQAADARAQSDAAADPNGVPAPAAPPTSDASRPPRKARSDDALLPVASNVIDLLAWVKANAAKDVAAKFARIRHGTDASTSRDAAADAPTASTAKVSADSRSESAVTPIAMPIAAPAPVIPLPVAGDAAADASQTADTAAQHSGTGGQS